MPNERYDLSREYFSGLNVPSETDVGARPRVDLDSEGRPNFAYPPIAQQLAGSGAWDGEADKVHVRGAGARTVTLADGAFTGQSVRIIDILRNAGSGTITIDPDGATQIDGANTLDLSTDGENALLEWSGTGWVRL